MIPMLFPHASSVFSHGSPNLSLTTLQYCHFDHAKRPQQHEPSVLPSHSPPTSPGRHWGSRHLRIVSAGSWINKDQVAKLQRKKNKFSRSCYSPVLLNQNIDSQTSWWWCQLRPQSSAPPVFFFGGGGANLHKSTCCWLATAVPASAPASSFTSKPSLETLESWTSYQFHGSMTWPNDVGRFSRLGKKPTNHPWFL